MPKGLACPLLWQCFLALRSKSHEDFGAADHMQSLGVIGRPRKSRAWRSNSMYPAGSTQSLISEGLSDAKLSRSSSLIPASENYGNLVDTLQIPDLRYGLAIINILYTGLFFVGGSVIQVIVQLLVLDPHCQSCGDQIIKSAWQVGLASWPFYKRIKLTWTGALLGENQMILITAFLIIPASWETEDQSIPLSTCFQEIWRERHLLFPLTAIILDSHIQLTGEARDCQ